jgi:hypothetical protein
MNEKAAGILAEIKRQYRLSREAVASEKTYLKVEQRLMSREVSLGKKHPAVFGQP